MKLAAFHQQHLHSTTKASRLRCAALHPPRSSSASHPQVRPPTCKAPGSTPALPRVYARGRVAHHAPLRSLRRPGREHTGAFTECGVIDLPGVAKIRITLWPGSREHSQLENLPKERGTLEVNRETKLCRLRHWVLVIQSTSLACRGSSSLWNVCLIPRQVFTCQCTMVHESLDSLDSLGSRA